jgi:hypothetical protein
MVVVGSKAVKSAHPKGVPMATRSPVLLLTTGKIQEAGGIVSFDILL